MEENVTYPVLFDFWKKEPIDVTLDNDAGKQKFRFSVSVVLSRSAALVL